MSVFRTCLNCMYFDASGTVLGNAQVRPDAAATGVCKHDPPTVFTVNGNSAWPDVASTDWCGQHAFQQQGTGSTFQTQGDITRQGGGRI